MFFFQTYVRIKSDRIILRAIFFSPFTRQNISLYRFLSNICSPFVNIRLLPSCVIISFCAKPAIHFHILCAYKRSSLEYCALKDSNNFKHFHQKKQLIEHDEPFRLLIYNNKIPLSLLLFIAIKNAFFFPLHFGLALLFFQYWRRGLISWYLIVTNSLALLETRDRKFGRQKFYCP